MRLSAFKSKDHRFDKTGTLTCGRLEVTAKVSVNRNYSAADILRYTALAEQKSEHPLGKAVLSCYMGLRRTDRPCQ